MNRLRILLGLSLGALGIGALLLLSARSAHLRAPAPEYLIGAVREQGDGYTVDPKPGYVSTDLVHMKKADVESVERGSVLTFHLRPGVRWHDGHPFDANDVAFSWRIYANPEVDC